MNKLVMRGAAAEVRWSYHSAAALKDWTVTADSTGNTLTAQVVSHDAFRVSQQPLTFVVPRPTGQWTWPITSLQIAGTALIATVGPPE